MANERGRPDRARRLLADGLKAKKLQAVFAESHYLMRIFDDVIKAFEDEELACQRGIIENIASGEWDPAAWDAPWSSYDFEGDECLADAAEVLPLPSGAEIVSADAGGMGCGYTAQFLMLAPGQTLADFGAWLETQEAES